MDSLPPTDALPRTQGGGLDLQRRVFEPVRFPARSARERRVDDPNACPYWIGKRNPLAGRWALSVSPAFLHTATIDPRQARLQAVRAFGGRIGDGREWCEADFPFCSAVRQCVYFTNCSMSDPPETSTARTAWPLPLA